MLALLGVYPKGPCSQIVYTLALKYTSLYRYFGAKLYAIWVHGPLGLGSRGQDGLRLSIGAQDLPGYRKTNKNRALNPPKKDPPDQGPDGTLCQTPRHR